MKTFKHYFIVYPRYYVHRYAITYQNILMIDLQSFYKLFNTIKVTKTYNNNSEQGADDVTSKHVTPMMLVVGDATHHRVPSEQHEQELHAVTEELRAAPCESLLKIHLFGTKHN